MSAEIPSVQASNTYQSPNGDWKPPTLPSGYDPNRIFFQEALDEAQNKDGYDGPMGPRYEALLAEADLVLGIATQLDESMGMDVAGQSYDQAMKLYLGALYSRNFNAPAPDYTFYLKLAGAQTKTATWRDLPPYENPLTSADYTGRGKDRREDLFMSASDGYQLALAGAGGIDASPEALTRIFTECANMHNVQAAFRQSQGLDKIAKVDLEASQQIVRGAMEIVANSSASEITPELVQRVDDLDTGVKEALMTDNTGELSLIATESLQDLVTIS